MIDLPGGVRAEILETIDSTNLEARRRIGSGDTGPVWITARRQTAGRGRQGRAWESPEGSFAATYLTRSDLSPAETALTGYVAALAVADALGTLAATADVSLKWPNDVLLNGAKISGILLESQPGAPRSPFPLMVGIGINLADAPPQHLTRWRATSILAETGHTPTVEETLVALAESFEHWRARFLADGFPPIRDAWIARAAHLGAQIEVRQDNETLTGLFTDLDGDGALVLQVGARRYTILAGDVFLPEIT